MTPGICPSTPAWLLTPLLDESVTDLCLNGAEEAWIDRGSGLEPIETPDEWVILGFAHGDYLKELGGTAQSDVYKNPSLDPAMRERLAQLNPTASAKLAHRLLEASRRQFWQPDAATLQALQNAGAELEDRLEGIQEGLPA